MPNTADSYWVAEHWPLLLLAMLGVFAWLMWKRRDKK